MNILVAINDRYVDYLVVMLTSLYRNNPQNITVYCLYKELSDENQKILKDHAFQNHASFIFIQVDATVYKEFPTTEMLTEECYFILMAHELLPIDLDRILYLDCDVIVDGKLEEFYQCSFDRNYMVVCGQWHKKIQGNFYGIGARPEKGQCFNSGVLLINLAKMRQDITINTYLNAAHKVRFNFFLADQGILNILFWDKVKYEDTLKYNFRLAIYERYVKEGNGDLPYKPVIYHYPNHDNYKIGWGSKPWNLYLNRKEYQELSKLGIAEHKYGDERVVSANLKMQDLWWEYAQYTEAYPKLMQQMKENSKKILEILYAEYQKCEEEIKKNKETFRKLAAFEQCTQSELKHCKYWELAKYIDTLPPEKAVEIMENLFRMNLTRLRKKETIKVAFIVYSSSEWQCEDLYRKMEDDRQFEPAIYICAYGHGKEEQIVHTYRETCRYFLKSDQKYNLEFGGCVNYMSYRKKLDEYDLIFNFNSVENLRPFQNNVGQRGLDQLFIQVPYGFFLVSREDMYYGEDFYERLLFKCSWISCAMNILEKMEMEQLQRMNAYNVISSGSLKMDAVLEKKVRIRPMLWKSARSESIKIIWAPHFNLQNGMNGTFHENYQWFYQYAKKHPEISWIVRPHPRMESGVLDKGVFENADKYREYLDKWDALPNARVIPFGDYLDVFITSDTMILDSISFVAEYQYTGKPLLFLESEYPRAMGIHGEQLFSHIYKARGNDFKKIEEFVDMILKHSDPMRDERKEFFETYLNHKKINGLNASQLIMNTIKSSLA